MEYFSSAYMCEEELPYGDRSVNKAMRPMKIVPFKVREKHRFWTTSEFWKRTDLSAEEKGLAGILMAHMDKSYCCWPTHPQLSKLAGIGHCKLERMLKRLKDKDIINWTHFRDQYGHMRNRYQILCLGLQANTYKSVVGLPLKSSRET